MQTDLSFSQLGGEVDPLRQEVALFRYGLISELTQLQPNHHGLYKLLNDKAEREYTIPGTLRRRVAAETIRGWLRDYRSGGFDALMPKVRRDHGSTRTIPTLVVDLLCQLKDDEPGLSIPAVAALAEVYPEKLRYFSLLDLLTSPKLPALAPLVRFAKALQDELEHHVRVET